MGIVFVYVSFIFLFRLILVNINRITKELRKKYNKRITYYNNEEVAL